MGNPFTIYNFYEQLEKIVNENNLCSYQMWNCDESGFPTNPQKCEVVSKKEKLYTKLHVGLEERTLQHWQYVMLLEKPWIH